MLDSLLKGPLTDFLKSKTGLAPDKSEQSAEVAKNTVVDNMKEEASNGNFDNIMGLLKSDTNPSNPLITKISNSLVGNLTSKVGLSPEMANKVTTMAIPFILSKIGSHTAQGTDTSALSNLLGGGSGMLGGLKDKLGGLGKLF